MQGKSKNVGYACVTAAWNNGKKFTDNSIGREGARRRVISALSACVVKYVRVREARDQSEHTGTPE
jgi:hypothetical protein